MVDGRTPRARQISHNEGGVSAKIVSPPNRSSPHPRQSPPALRSPRLYASSGSAAVAMPKNVLVLRDLRLVNEAFLLLLRAARQRFTRLGREGVGDGVAVSCSRTRGAGSGTVSTMDATASGGSGAGEAATCALDGKQRGGAVERQVGTLLDHGWCGCGCGRGGVGVWGWWWRRRWGMDPIRITKV